MARKQHKELSRAGAAAFLTSWSTAGTALNRFAGRFVFERRKILDAKVLVLNRSFLPVHITTVRRACTLLYLGAARVVDVDFRTFDFETWLSREPDGAERIGLVTGAMQVPRVVLLTHVNRVYRRTVRFSRNNVFERDGHTCQYCGRRFPRTQLNLDHVVPRSQGGTSTWHNVVCACIACNRRKGGRSPSEARMQLIRRPVRPEWTPFAFVTLGVRRYPEWRPFLGHGSRMRERSAAGAHM